MDTNFNPYHQWLELDSQIVQPNYYELLGLQPGEQNAQKIAEAADHATAKVRSCRPGPHAAQWASLLDELKTAKSCLLDADQRAQYDAQLRQGGTASSQEATGGEPLADFSSQPSQAPVSNDMYPPGMGSSSGTPGPLPQPAPAAQPQTGAYGGADATGNAPTQAPLAGQPAPAQPQAAQPQQYAPQSPTPAATPAPQAPHPQAPSSQPPNPQAPLAGAPYNAPAPGGYGANPMTPAANPAAQLPTPQNPAAQMPGAGPPAYYPTGPAQPAAPAAGAQASYPAQPAAPAAAPNPMDPMAPVNVGDASTQPHVAQPQANPAPAAAPAGPDPMAPVAPAGMAGSSAADSVVPLGGANQAAMAQPAGQPVAQPADPNASGDSEVQVAGDKSNIAKASEHRNQTRRTLTTVAIGLGMFLLSASVIYFVVSSALGDKEGKDEDSVAQADKDKSNGGTGENGKGANGNNGGKGDSPDPSPTPEPAPMPQPTPQPEPSPVPQPNPMPRPEPPNMPMPEPQPEPAPMPEPPPEPMPTAEETRMLAEAMTAAREALENKNPEAAAEEIAKVESVTMTDEQKAMLNRLKKVTGLVQEFWDAEREARIKLQGLDALKTPAGNEILIVESSPELLIVRAPGQNKRFGPREEHTNFAALLVDQVLPPADPANQFIKGAAFVVEEDPEWRPKGVELWKAAAGFSDEGTELLTFLEDSYDFANP